MPVGMPVFLLSVILVAVGWRPGAEYQAHDKRGCDEDSLRHVLSPPWSVVPVDVVLAHDERVDAIFRSLLLRCRFLAPSTGCATWRIGLQDHFIIKQLHNHQWVADART
jgi:hypothetical protein